MTAIDGADVALPCRAKVGLMGPSGVGKTTFLAVLDRALKNRSWNVEAEDQHGLLDEIRRHMSNGLYPPPTDPKTMPKGGIRFRVHRGDRAIELAFMDPPGEMFDPVELDHGRHTELKEAVFGSLNGCTGLLMLLNLDLEASKLVTVWNYAIRQFVSYARANNLTQASGKPIVQSDGKLAIRVAVVFTKADQIPFMSRHRTDDARHWLEAHAELKTLVEDVMVDCANARFYFSSSVGWQRGAPDCRWVFKPVNLSTADNEGPLIPDPAVTIRDPQKDSEPEEYQPGRRSRSAWPQFRDPLSISKETLPEPQGNNIFGLVALPGRKRGGTLRPWNVVEPLLWAADMELCGTSGG